MICCSHSSLPCIAPTRNSSVSRSPLLGWHSCNAAAHRVLKHSSDNCHTTGDRRQQPVTRVCSIHSRKCNRRIVVGAQAKAAIDNLGAGEPTRQQQVWTLPTILTVCRVLAIPILIAVWYSQSQSASLICCGIFLAASFTDFLDGYLARRMGLISNFGAFLDPVADKLMVAAVLILLSSRPLTTGPLTGNTWVLPVISSVIIGREIAMSALRELAASLGGDAYSAVAVSSWGKWKTATQMASLTLMLLSTGGSSGPVYSTAASVGLALLFFATLLTVLSLADYMRGLWKYL